MQFQLITVTLFAGFALSLGISIFLWVKLKHFKRRLTLKEEEIRSIEALTYEKSQVIDQLNVKYANVIEIDKYVEDTKQKLYEERTAKRAQVNQYVSESRSSVDKEVLEKMEKGNQYYEAKVKESEAITNSLQELNQKYINALQLYKALEMELSIYQDELEVKDFGLYKPMYNFDTSEEYKSKLEYNYLCQKQSVQSDVAAHCRKEWTVDGSVVEGRKMVKLQKKLMLFAFNGECDAMIAKMKWNTATRTIERVEKAYDTINKLGRANEIQITYEYLLLKKEELALSHEYLNKIQEEKEEQRMIREQMREEEKAKREYEIAQKEAAEDEQRYQKALLRVKDELQYADKGEVDTLNSQIRQLEEKLKEATEKKERAISMAQLTKVGHIYIISNIGSFGEDIYKIGMTRRLDPNDRVRELGGASVPFQFDVHAIIYSDNAPQMEYELHKQFKDKRINRVNGRKEFFKISLEEIEAFVNQDAGASIKITKSAEAREFRETMALINSMLAQNEIIEIEAESKFPESLI